MSGVLYRCHQVSSSHRFQPRQARRLQDARQYVPKTGGVMTRPPAGQSTHEAMSECTIHRKYVSHVVASHRTRIQLSRPLLITSVVTLTSTSLPQPPHCIPFRKHDGPLPPHIALATRPCPCSCHTSFVPFIAYHPGPVPTSGPPYLAFL